MAIDISVILEQIMANRLGKNPANPRERINKLLHQNFTPDIEQIAEQCPPRQRSLRIKRIFDIFLTIPALLLSFPVFLIIAVLIKLDSSGPVFFTQKRVGQFGSLFKIYKFRTMEAGTEKLGKFFICENDECITRIGRILRKYKLDELPQLWNVLKGDMSLVGPRPMIPRIVAQYPTSVRNVVLSVPPGITGFGSLVYMNESAMLENVANPKQLYTKQIIPMKLYYFVNYVKIHNLWLDLQIVFLTIIFLFRLTYHSHRKNKVSDSV